MSRIKLIDPVTGKIIYDSENDIPEQHDPERDHIVAGVGWKLQTPEQLENELEQFRPSRKDCRTCMGKGTVDLPVTGVMNHLCPTCRGVDRD